MTGIDEIGQASEFSAKAADIVTRTAIFREALSTCRAPGNAYCGPS